MHRRDHGKGDTDHGARSCCEHDQVEGSRRERNECVVQDITEESSPNREDTEGEPSPAVAPDPDDGRNDRQEVGHDDEVRTEFQMMVRAGWLSPRS